MRLNTKSWHYKLWAGSFSHYEHRPTSTDLCRYCHRVFWQLVLYAFMFGCIGMLIFMLGYGAIYQGLVLHTKVALIVGGAIAAVIGAVVLYTRWLHGSPSYQQPKTLVGKYARAAKQGVCPLVTFSSESEESGLIEN